MRFFYITLSLLLYIAPISNVCANNIQEKILPPIAKKEKYEQIIHDNVIIDYYHWLKDKTLQNTNNSEIITHLINENKYSEN